VRLYDGTLVANVNQELADSFLEAGAAEAFRRGSRRYLRLRRGIHIPRTERGWDVIEGLRAWHGDKKAAGYVAHFDRQSESVSTAEPSTTALAKPSKAGVTVRSGNDESTPTPEQPVTRRAWFQRAAFQT
jgi:hypothetical protein